MEVKLHKKFRKRLDKLSTAIQDKVNDTIERFIEDPFDPSLHNHALRGRQLGRRAISVTGDIRIIFEEYNNYMFVLMLDVGTHNQVYSNN